MKNRLSSLDPVLQSKIEGLTSAQIRQMAEIFMGLAIAETKTKIQQRSDRAAKRLSRN